MLQTVRTWLRGLALLRRPEVLNHLGQRRLEILKIREIRRLFPTAKVSEDVELAGYETGRLDLGELASVCRGTVLAFGDETNGFGRIRLGARTWLGQYNNLRACEGGDIVIGSNCLVSQFCTLVGSNHAIGRDRLIVEQGPDRSRLGVTLGDDVWLGAGVAVMPGVAIATGAVVGANSVVTQSIPKYEIWAGCPARKIGERT